MKSLNRSIAPRVAIAGGGLGGMTAALRLAEKGCQVTIFEASSRLGGKAGSDLIDGRWEDHGYHMFPAFYLNLWAIVDELSIRKNFRAVNTYNHVFAGEFPRFRAQENWISLATVGANLKAGILSVPEQLLLCYAVLDFIGEPLDGEGPLDDVAVLGLLRSRFYRTRTVASALHQTFLKGAAVAGHHMSARAVQRVMGYWAAYPTPVAAVARGSLQQMFIEPFERRLSELGVSVQFGATLKRLEFDATRRVAGLRIEAARAESMFEDFDAVVLAIPADRLPSLLDDDLCRVAPSLARSHKLRCAPMAVLHLYLDQRYPGIPLDTATCAESPFALTFHDISQHWSGFDKTALQFVVGDSTALLPLSDDAARRMLLAEIDRFLPGLSERVVHAHYRSHVDQPIFVNDVGCSPYQPRSVTEVRNLFVAGEHCHSSYGLAGMENAVITGLQAAEGARRALGLPARPVVIQHAKPMPRWKARSAKLLLTPVAALSKVAASAWPRASRARATSVPTHR